MAVNAIKKAEKFCWLCYSESVRRFARTLPSRALREAVLAEAEKHRNDGGPVPTQWEHQLHLRRPGDPEPEPGPGEAREVAHWESFAEALLDGAGDEDPEEAP
jgi:hypothetical protein